MNSVWDDMAYPTPYQPSRLYTVKFSCVISGILVKMDGAGVEWLIQYLSHQCNCSGLRNQKTTIYIC